MLAMHDLDENSSYGENSSQIGLADVSDTCIVHVRRQLDLDSNTQKNRYRKTNYGAVQEAQITHWLGLEPREAKE